MIKMMLMFGLILVIGYAALSSVSEDLADELVFFVFWIVVIAAVLKVFLDFVLHFMKDEEESEIDEMLEDDDDLESYNKIEDYVRARKKRDRDFDPQ